MCSLAETFSFESRPSKRTARFTPNGSTFPNMAQLSKMAQALKGFQGPAPADVFLGVGRWNARLHGDGSSQRLFSRLFTDATSFSRTYSRMRLHSEGRVHGHDFVQLDVFTNATSFSRAVMTRENAWFRGRDSRRDSCCLNVVLTPPGSVTARLKTGTAQSPRGGLLGVVDFWITVTDTHSTKTFDHCLVLPRGRRHATRRCRRVTNQESYPLSCE
jgi:hypothetical protein